ncbi:hypothetical protein pipiens_018744, partial [Culex pipiens pipiens]
GTCFPRDKVCEAEEK